ncbi:hypothetical protein TNCV_1049141 [Trichonephila clavipes]|nr:hypothetical protein TNCV_1049141 [Trichonephila clavipes]
MRGTEVVVVYATNVTSNFSAIAQSIDYLSLTFSSGRLRNQAYSSGVLTMCALEVMDVWKSLLGKFGAWIHRHLEGCKCIHQAQNYTNQRFIKPTIPELNCLEICRLQLQDFSWVISKV